MASTSPDVSVGALIDGKYRVERHVGVGGMGYVVAARHETLGELYAIKVMADATDDTLRKRFMREAKAAARITSAHIAKVFDVGQMDDGAAFMVMELLEGEDLDSHLVRNGPLRLTAAVGYVLQACEALSEAHGLGIVHRDVKPSNLFLCKTTSGEPMVKLLDFGISKDSVAATGPITKLTDVGSVLGSPLFMAPEQLVSSSDVDARADIWSIGVTLFELVTGKAAFDGDTMTDLYTSILRHDPRKLTSFRPDLPRDLERIIERCLEKDPYDRYDTVAELVTALSPFAPPSAQDSIKRITKNVEPIAATVSGEDLIATLKRDEPSAPTLAETLSVPLTRRKEPSLSSAKTTVMEREPEPKNETPSWPPPPPTPLQAPPAKSARWPLVILVLLAVAVLIAGGYRYYASQASSKSKPTKKKKKKSKSKPKKRKRSAPSASPPTRADVPVVPERELSIMRGALTKAELALVQDQYSATTKAAHGVLSQLREHGFRRGRHPSVLGARAESLIADTFARKFLDAFPDGNGTDMNEHMSGMLQAYQRADEWDPAGTHCTGGQRLDRLREIAEKLERRQSAVAAADYWLLVQTEAERHLKRGITDTACIERIKEHLERAKPKATK